MTEDISVTSMIMQLTEEYIEEARKHFDEQNVEFDEPAFIGYLVGRLAVLEGKL